MLEAQTPLTGEKAHLGNIPADECLTVPVLIHLRHRVGNESLVDVGVVSGPEAEDGHIANALPHLGPILCHTESAAGRKIEKVIDRPGYQEVEVQMKQISLEIVKLALEYEHTPEGMASHHLRQGELRHRLKFDRTTDAARVIREAHEP